MAWWGQADLAADGLRGLRRGEEAAGAHVARKGLQWASMPCLCSFPVENREAQVSGLQCVPAVIDPPGRGGIQPILLLPLLPSGHQTTRHPPVTDPASSLPGTQVGAAAASLGGAKWAVSWVWTSPSLLQLGPSSGQLGADLVWPS